MFASRETISHPQLQCCQNKKRLCLQCKSCQQNQQIVLRISFLNSATASLLIECCRCTKEEITLIVWLRKARIVETCRMKQRCISPANRDHVWMGAMKKDMLLILYVISIAVTSRGNIVR